MRHILCVGFLFAVAIPYVPSRHVVQHHAVAIASKPADVPLLVREVIDTTNELNATKADRDAKAAEIAEKDKRIAALEASSSGVGGRAVATTYSGNGPYPNHFIYGYCTWYVATRRYIPWFGNAIAWLGQAQAYGYPTGSTPRVGAIMVTTDGWPWNPFGHVAYVESVSPLVVSEMNYVRWAVVDTRHVTDQSRVVGYVY